MRSPERTIRRDIARRGFTDHALFGMAVFVFTEIMLFAGFLSAFVINRNLVPPGSWPPPDQPRLPFERTAINTALLLASGVLVIASGRIARRSGARARLPFTLGLVLGASFVGLQGFEWVALLRHGLTITSSQLGSFFYLIIGTHAVHAVVALGVLASCWSTLLADLRMPRRFLAAQLLWLFVVLVWPVLWLVVYR